MIGFNHLGKLGRLCNQMFQYSALKGISRNKNYEFCIPFSSGINEWEDHQLFKCFDISVNTGFLSDNYIQESSFNFDKRLFDECPDNISLVGYFQTEKYFIHIKEEIKNDFKFKSDIHTACVEAISSLNNPIALHIRRTDFITNPNHYILPIEYYETALTYYDSNRDVLVFSDDTDWCFNQKLFSNDRFLISEDQDAYHDLCLMTLCKDVMVAISLVN